ncbi:MAG: TIGR02466 family protein, partial [Hyphomonas sp.]|nr:TIGR02466 family protein [Hyphomonas sp.]
MRQLFTTRIEEKPLGDEDLRARVERATWVLESDDAAGNAWCVEEGYPGYTSYASLDDLPERFPEFAELKALLDKAAAKFARAQHWDMAGLKLELDAIWVNILGPGGHHSGHIHPGSVISGTYYVRVPDGAGRIRFEDPRLPMMMAAPQLKDDAPEAARRFVYVTPAEGTCLMWESWLRHEVMPSESEEARMSVSFNYAV